MAPDAQTLIFPKQCRFPPVGWGDQTRSYTPICGYLFEGTGSRDEYLSFSFIQKEKYPKGIPFVDKYALCIPQEFEDYRVGVTMVGSRPGPEQRLNFPRLNISVASADHVQAEIRVSARHVDTGERDHAETGTATVREGDILILPYYGGFVVRHIVPRSDKTRAIGWVDLDCHIIEANVIVERAARENRKVVRFDLTEVPQPAEDPAPDREVTEEPAPPWRIIGLSALGTLGVVIGIVFAFKR